ncbi:MAG: hypothetical protein K6T75_01715 [Acetobacteraceae bacterium]|nr:hypothetical protein [Acetobacteraceae bacterium]
MRALYRVAVPVMILVCLLAAGCRPQSPQGAPQGPEPGPPPGQAQPPGSPTPPPPGAEPPAAAVAPDPTPGWEGMVAAIPAAALPFPRDQVARAWKLSDGRLLLEQVENLDRSFFLYDGSQGKGDWIVGFIETATFLGEQGGSLFFFARGGGDTADYSFPYRVAYELESGRMSREALFLPLSQPVAFGKNGWRQVLSDLSLEGATVGFSFVPHPEAVLAGGHSQPLTTVRYETGAGALMLQFFGVDMGDKLKERASPDGVMQFSVTPAAGQTLPITQVSVRQLPAGGPPAFPDVLQQGFPYGLALSDLSGLVERPSVRVDLLLNGASQYSLETSRDPQGGVLQYTLRVR